MGLHPSMGTLVSRESGLALVPHPIGDGENRSWESWLLCSGNSEVPGTAGADCTQVQPVGRDAWKTYPYASTPKAPPAVLGRSWWPSHKTVWLVHKGAPCLPRVRVGAAILGIHHG